MKEFLVTGGAGFIASHLAARLLADGAKVYVADDLSTGDLGNVPKGAEFIQIDLSDSGSYQKLESVKPSAVFHLAGQSSGEVSFDSPPRDMDVNTRSTMLLADWALKRGCSRFLYASSVSIYGNGIDGKPMAETHPAAPISFYGCSKISSERYLSVFRQSYGLKTTCFRLFNVFGPGQNLKNMRQGMASIYLSFLLHQSKIVVKGSLDRKRDFIYISDLVDLFVRSLDDERTYGGVFNAGTGVGTSVRDLLALMCRLAGKEGFPIETAAGTPGDAFQSVADMTFVSETLNWTPKITLEEGLRRMIEAYQP